MKYYTIIKKLRIEKGLTQKELADIMECSVSAISGWERGARELDFTTLKKYYEIFNVSTDYILGLTDIRQYTKEGKPIMIVEREIPFKSYTLKDIYHMLNSLSENDLLTIKGYVYRYYEKYERTRIKVGNYDV